MCQLDAGPGAIGGVDSVRIGASAWGRNPLVGLLSGTKRVPNRLREYRGSPLASSAQRGGLASSFDNPVRLHEVRWRNWLNVNAGQEVMPGDEKPFKTYHGQHNALGWIVTQALGRR